MFFFILTVISFIIFFAVTLPFLIILLIVRLFNPMLAARIGQPIVCGFGFRLVLLFSGCRREIRGRENIPKNTPVLFVSNHRGFFDIPAAYSAVPVTHVTQFVSKKEIRKVPFLSWWMIVLNCVFIDRSNPKAGLKSIQKSIEDVKNGFSVFIMPEGTRSSEPGVQPFKGGSFKIAERTGCPVIPVAITNADDVFENHKPKVKPHKMGISFGKPIITQGLTRDELRDVPGQAYDEVVRLYEELKASEKK
ncbi:MAG: 1-acylglycerol-3-phosphate O-acyltransferase [Lachnospiraceae bacterium]|nr:1-acylglycerol-3-phosphate O-acyltransferase [Lachnospiraceae bacterium]